MSIAWAYQLAGRHPYWHTALLLVVAGMVPEDKRADHLLAWNLQN
ncbi:MAG: hypothetical protein ACRDTX_30750 [Pseudonocardiaceae bacterium]